VQIPTFSEKYRDIKNAILERRTDINVQINSVVSDTFIVPIILEIINQNIRQEYISRAQSIDLIITMKTDDTFLEQAVDAFNISKDQLLNEISLLLDDLVANYGITRKSATKATGTVQLGRAEIPTFDIYVPQGSVFSTSGGIQFKSLSNYTMYAAMGSSYYDSDLNLYVLNISVEAVEAGTSGNAVSSSINTIVTPITGMEVVTNKESFVNGTDDETDDELVTRTKTVFLGNNIGTKDGYKKLILNNTDVTDLYVSSAEDPFMIRDEGTGGDIDIYILDRKDTQVTNEVYTTSQEFQILTKQPVKEIAFVSSGTYIFEKDGTDFETIYAGSIYGSDRLHFTTLSTAPYIVSYVYDGMIEEVQNLLNQDENKILGHNVLIKQAIQKDVDISFTISVLTGYTKASVIDDITDTLSEYVNGLKLGKNLQQSDVIAVVEAVEGVDRIVLPLTVFDESGSTDSNDVIEATAREFIRLKTLTIL